MKSITHSDSVWRSARLGFALLGVLVVLSAAVSTLNLPGRDFIQFWTAGRALSAGVSPYDQNFEAITQQANGWDIRREPIPFQPYFYPPWLAMLMWPLSLLPHSLARAAWLVLSFGALAISLAVMVRAVQRSPRPSTILIVTLLGFGFLATLNSLIAGQPHGALLLLLAGLIWSIDHQRDRLAGICLGLLSIKPQLGLIIAAVVMLAWVWQRRWSPLCWTLLTWLALAGVSFIFTPNWLSEMLSAPQRFTALTGWTFPLNGYQDDPTWWAAFRVNVDTGSPGVVWPIGGLMILVALLIRQLRRRIKPTFHWLIAVACASVFIFTPYARLYDFTVLIWPLIYFAFSDGASVRPIVRRSVSLAVYLFSIGTLLLNAQGVSNVIAPVIMLAALLFTGPIER